MDITIKTATFDFQKKILSPVYLLTQRDKWDDIRSPMTDLKNLFVLALDKLLRTLTGVIEIFL